MNKLIAFMLAAAIALTIVVVSADPGSDVDGNGKVNSLDLLRVALDFNEDHVPNPCIEYRIFDETVQPTYIIVNSFDEVITPRGGYWLYPGDHPARDAIKAGTPIPPRACDGTP